MYRFGECPFPFTNEICFLGGKYLPALWGRKVVAAHIASQQFLHGDKDFSVSFSYFLGLLSAVFTRGWIFFCIAFSPRNPRQYCTPALSTLRSNINHFSGLSVLFSEWIQLMQKLWQHPINIPAFFGPLRPGGENLRPSFFLFS